MAKKKNKISASSTFSIFLKFDFEFEINFLEFETNSQLISNSIAIIIDQFLAVYFVLKFQ